jgi:D-alanyl-D-alanine carboxypeptidase
METEQAIRKLDINMQALFRILATKKLKQISASSSQHNTSTKRQSYILKAITSELKKENAIIVKADKGKTSVIIYTNDYNKKSA